MKDYKERWQDCYDQAEDELGEDALDAQLLERAEELFTDLESSLVDEAYDRVRDQRVLDG